MTNLKKLIKSYLFFSEPKKIEQFILKENSQDVGKLSKKEKAEGKLQEEIDQEDIKQEESKNKKNENLLLNKLAKTTPKEKENQKKENESYDKPSDISENLKDNLDRIKKVYSVPINGDIVLREFKIIVKDKAISAFIVLIDGLADRKVVDDDILQPLMLLSNLDIKGDEKEIAEFIKNHLLPHNQLKETKNFRDVIDEVNFGGCGIFIDKVDIAFTADVKGWEHRNVSRPNTELVIRGPQEGFIENVRSNTALVRKILKDEDLIVENMTVGFRSKTPCAIMYIRDITNDEIVKEVKRRIKGISVDYIIDSGELEQYLEDSSVLPTPQITATERPDRVAGMLVDGKVAVILHGSPFALVMPTTSFDLINTPEDIYLRFPYGTALRFIRIFAIILALLLPGMYVAITNYHHDMIPTDLLFAVSAAREKVPFPSVVEILIMEIAFELIREAGIRIPGPIGPTLGIIGALILGQAAVAANIVSPILIIIVAVTGIGSFAFPNFSMALSFRLLRFGYIFLGAIAGFLGITTGLFIHGIWTVSAKSFGVPFMVPFAPRTTGGLADSFVRGPLWKQEKRPDYVNPKDLQRQPRISRKWKYPDDKEGNNDSE